MKIWPFIFTLLISVSTQAQSNDECKYFQVISFIRTNSEFNNQIKDYLILNKAFKKANFIDLHISPWIKFIAITQFKDKINSDSVGISKDILTNDRLYFKAYNFEYFKSSLLEKTTNSNEKTFYLTFSKVIGNTLLVEILNYDNGPQMINHFGSGVKVLFIFDKFGIIKTTLFNKVVYN